MSDSASPAASPVLARMSELLGTPLASEVDVLQLVRYGMTSRMWQTLNQRAPLPPDLIVPHYEVRMTLALERRFSPSQTDALVEVVRLIAQAWEIHGDLPAALAWLAVEREILPGYPPLSGWSLATSHTGARVVEALLGLGPALPTAPPAPSPSQVDVDALLGEKLHMSQTDLDWADALAEQRAAGLPPVEATSTAVGADVDIDAVLSDVAVDRHDLDWAEAMAEQRAGEQLARAGAGEPAAPDVDVEALLADVEGQSNSWQLGASADQVVKAASHEGLLGPRRAA